jgi:peptidoglycan/LPS O-acetylase OafA/YrhL
MSGETTQRIHYLDNLRALAMLLGVFLHGGLAYANPGQNVWLATDTQSSTVVDASIWFIHLFRMSLFFLLSGYFAKLLINKRGVGKFLWNRTVRVVFPFVLFYPFLYVAMIGTIIFALSSLEQPRGLIGLIAAAAKSAPSSETSRPPATMHLWFLYYLFGFSVLAALFSRLSRIRFDWLFRRRWLLALAPCALIPAVMKAGFPLPAPESFVPTWWPFAFYGLFFWAGWQLFGRESGLEALQPYTWYLVVGCVTLYIPYYWYMPYLDLSALTMNQALPVRPAIALMESVLTAYLSVGLTISALLVGKTLLSGKSSWLKFFADASYWVYLIHLPVVVFLQTVLIGTEWNVWIELGLVLIGTTAFCMATYVVFVRYTPLGWLLHGKRSFP